MMSPSSAGKYQVALCFLCSYCVITIIFYLFHHHDIHRQLQIIYSTQDMPTAPSEGQSSAIDSNPAAETSVAPQYWKNASFNASEYLQTLYNQQQDLGADILRTCELIVSTRHDVANVGLGQRQVWSQAFQEWFVFHQFFYGKQNGVYVDVGVNDAFLNSNTVFFDLCMGWKGICVEASQTLAAKISETRSCSMATKCAWSSTSSEPMKMLYSDGGTRVISETEYEAKKQENDPNLFECDTISASDLLGQYPAINKFHETVNLDWNQTVQTIEIDFISLDIEGSEEEFLRCFPFDKYDVKVWSIEINKRGKEAIIDRILLHYGYSKFTYLPFWGYDLDAIYIKHNGLQPPYEHPEFWGNYKTCDV